MVAHHREGRDHLHRCLKSKWAGSVVELALSVSGVSSGKRFVAEIGLKACRKESMAYVLVPGVSGVRRVVDDGGMVVNRRRGDEMLLCRADVSVGVSSDLLVVLMDGSLTDLVSVGLR